jgi:7,8-dihydro-6-hydroxymethylpterin dimethyltransferase
MNSKSTGSSLVCPDSSAPLFSSQSIISKGDTLCPKCKAPTKALWVKSPPRKTDAFGPKRYMYKGVFSEKMPGTVTLKFKCQACQYVHEGIVFSDDRFFHPSGKGEVSSCGTACACRASDGEPVSPLGTNALGTQRVFTDRFDHFDKLSPCVLLEEIVKTCNWSCPTCLASSAKVLNPSDYTPLEQFKLKIQGVIDRRDQDIEILQLSGGEPTLHPQFFEILQWAQEHPRIHVVMINTNGTKLGSLDFAKRLHDMVDRKKVHLYLKFNGPTENAQTALAGFNAHSIEMRALDFVCMSNIATTLAMTVIRSNLKDLWLVAKLGLSVPSVRGVNYQPRFGGGRIEKVINRLVDAGHVINNLIDQSQDGDRQILTENSIVPLPCGDPNCQFIGMLHRPTLTCIGSAVSLEERLRLLAFLKDKINYGSADLTKCGCETTDLGQLIGQLEHAGQMFRLSIKPFMTFGGAVHNWSCNRTDQCCTSVVDTEGKLHSFCRVYNGLDGEGLLWK